MKTGLNAQAFTVVEVMIVLAVTGALLAMALTLVSGQQGKTEFYQAANDIQAQISDVINNVSTGYYANNGDVACDATGGVPNPKPGNGTVEGANKGCVFYGRAMQFDADNNREAYNVYDMVGLQQTSSGTVPQSPTEAAPVVIAPPSSSANTTEQRKLLYGLEVGRMSYGGGDISSVAFASSPASYTDGDLSSGSLHVDLYAIKTSAGVFAPSNGESASAAVGKIKAANMDLVTSNVTICFNSGGTNQSAAITIGGNGNKLSTILKVNSGKCT